MIYFIPSLNITEDSKTLLNLLPQLYYKESFDERNNSNDDTEGKKNQNISHIIMKRYDVGSEAIFLVQNAVDNMNDYKAGLASASNSSINNNLPSACIAIPNTEFESVLKMAKNNFTYEKDVRSATIKLPGGSNILFISKTELLSSSQSQLSLFTKHIVENILPPSDDSNNYDTFSQNSQNMTQISSLTLLEKQNSMSHKGENINMRGKKAIMSNNKNSMRAEDGNRPYFPSLTVNVLQQNEKENKFIPIFPNSISAKNIETDLLLGKLMLILRTEDPNNDLYFHERIFKGRGRRFELQLQFKLKKVPDGVLYCGGEVTGYLKLGLLAKGVSNLILNLLQKLTRDMYYSFGAKDGSENSRIVFPLWTFVDRLVITKPGEQPPELGTIIHEPKESISKRKASDNTGDWELGNIYTLSFNSSNIDMPTWTLVNLPFIPSTDLHSFWGDSNLHIVAYDVPQQKRKMKHSQDMIQYALNIQITHDRDQSRDDVDLFDYDTIDDEEIEDITDDETSCEIHDDDSCVFLDAFETESEIPSHDQQNIGQTPATKKNTFDVLCSAWVNMYCTKDKRYKTLYSFVTNDNVVFHSSLEFFKTFSIKNNRSDGSNTKENRLSTSESNRRFMGNFMDTILQNKKSKTFQKFKKFMEKSSKYSNHFLSIPSPQMKSISDDSKHYTCVARALSEYHWIEEWTVITNRYISFYRADQKKPQYLIALSNIMSVRRLTSTNIPCLPSYHFVAIETLGRTTYIMLKNYETLEKWLLTIEHNLKNSSLDSFVHDAKHDVMTEFCHNSSMWKCKKRRILNCRRFLFHPFMKDEAVKDPCKLSRDILRKALTMIDSSEDNLRDFLDSTAEFKAVDVSKLESTDRLAFFLNLYHIMVIHGLLILSPPNAFKFASFYNTVSYQCSDDIFSIAELEHNIIRNKMSSPSHFISKWVIPSSSYTFALDTNDYRINFALNCASKSNPPCVPIYNSTNINAQLNKVMKLSLSMGSDRNAKNSAIAIEIPRVCHWYMKDFGCKKNSDFLKVLGPFFKKSIKEKLNKKMNEKGYIDHTNYVIKFSSFDYSCRDLSLLNDD